MCGRRLCGARTVEVSEHGCTTCVSECTCAHLRGVLQTCVRSWCSAKVCVTMGVAGHHMYVCNCVINNMCACLTLCVTVHVNV